MYTNFYLFSGLIARRPLDRHFSQVMDHEVIPSEAIVNVEFSYIMQHGQQRQTQPSRDYLVIVARMRRLGQ